MLRFPPAGGRMENRIFLPSNETAGSLMLAPVKLVIGVTTPSGAMGESLKRLPLAHERLRLSSPAVLTKTRASVVCSCWIKSSGALSRQPVAPSEQRMPTDRSERKTPRAWFASRSIMIFGCPWVGIPASRSDRAIERKPDRLLQVVVGHHAFAIPLLAQHGGLRHLGADREVAADVELEASAQRQRVLGDGRGVEGLAWEHDHHSVPTDQVRLVTAATRASEHRAQAVHD